ncbi:hypothetical protein SMG44B_30029 [Stenotrophomonas maltophilia]
MENCRRWGGSDCGGVRRMGPRHASGGLGRTPTPGLAVCAGQRTRASGDRAYMGEGALLEKHCFASARTHSRQRLGRAPEGDLQRPPQPDPPRDPPGTQLLLRLLLLPWPEAGAGCNPADTLPVLGCGYRQPRRRDGGDRVVAAVRGRCRARPLPGRTGCRHRAGHRSLAGRRCADRAACAGGG